MLKHLAALVTPDMVRDHLNGMNDAELEQTLRQLAPTLTPAKFMAFVRVIAAEMARRNPKP